MKMSRVAAVAAVSVIALAVPASANHSWGGYHWAGNGTNITLKVNKAVDSRWTSYVNTAISQWDQSSELTLVNQNAPAGTSAKKCSPIAGQILVCNSAYGQRGWLGIASIWLTNGHISQATTKLNDTYHDRAPYNSPEYRALVACQEIGHDFGLDHQDENFDNPNLGTCMDYTSNPAGPPANTGPNKHDYDQLTAIYNHDDGFTTASAGTNFGIRQVGKAVPQVPSSEAIGDSPAAWGRAIHKDSRGRPDVFVKEIRAGEKVVTHVFWALETKRADIE
jgi:hypothetical protein